MNPFSLWLDERREQKRILPHIHMYSDHGDLVHMKNFSDKDFTLMKYEKNQKVA